jgi:hypothetical protein
VALTLDWQADGQQATIRQGGDVTSGGVVVEELDPEDAD